MNTFKVVNTCRDGYIPADERFVEHLPPLLKPQAEVMVKFLNEVSADTHRTYKAVDFNYTLK